MMLFLPPTLFSTGGCGSASFLEPEVLRCGTAPVSLPLPLDPLAAALRLVLDGILLRCLLGLWLLSFRAPRPAGMSGFEAMAWRPPVVLACGAARVCFDWSRLMGADF